MIKVCIVGALGKMGRSLADAIANSDGLTVLAGIDIKDSDELAYPVFSSFDALPEQPDVVIDFSRPESLDKILAYCQDNAVPMLICTTGHSAEQKALIAQAAERTAVFFTSNTSLGVALMRALITTASKILGESYDIEIFEKHHNRKVDAPSGTAMTLFETLNEARGGSLVPVYDRQSLHRPRTSNEVGMMSYRGGTVTGEHSVYFVGVDEEIEIKHVTTSNGVFVTGALRAIRFMAGKPAGTYDMAQVLAL
ncbi:MAG: 4-hydroxy-tetrahydrodipicolinate reductase [Clostridia bacterium]|nr:4-hydroxy-tetrahydrodipicolinate reductase [Clostridia bacterium]